MEGEKIPKNTFAKFFTKEELVNELERNGIETRPIMAGNITKHASSVMRQRAFN